MTREAMATRVLEWDAEARKRGDCATRKILWRLLDALGGRAVAPNVETWLALAEQTPTIQAIREELGVDDAPVWAGRVSA